MVDRWRIFKRGWPAGCCLLCDSSADSLLCRACRDELPGLTTACEYCTLPLPLPGICPRCRRRPPPYRATVACRYEYPVPRLVQWLKFGGRPELGAELGGLLLERIARRARPPAGEMGLLPMPLHWRRQLGRGYNQAAELARPLAHGLGIPLLEEACRRARATRPQSELVAGERRRNVRDAFVVTPGVRLPERVIVVDDVLTSGHTAAALARCLYRAGARSVEIWALARAGLQGFS